MTFSMLISPLVVWRSVAAMPWRERCAIPLALLGDDHDLHRPRALEKRHGIPDGARGGAGAVPADDDAIKLEPLLLDIGHHDHRAPGLEQGSLDREILGGDVIALRLPDDGKIE